MKITNNDVCFVTIAVMILLSVVFCESKHYEDKGYRLCVELVNSQRIVFKNESVSNCIKYYLENE